MSDANRLPTLTGDDAPATGTGGRGGRRAAIAGIAVDVLAPTVVYFAGRAAGLDARSALLASTVVAALRLGYVAVRTRRFDVFAAILMAVYGLSFAAALMTGDARLLLLRDSVTTGGLAIGLLLSCWAGRPLIYLAAKGASSRAGELAWERRWANEPEVRHTFVTMTAVWGAGLLVEAAVRVPLVYLLSTDVMAGLSSALQAVAIVALVIWSVRYVKRRQRGAAAGG